MHPSSRSRLLRHLGQAPQREAERWLRRAECQIEFAAALADWHGEGAGLVSKARNVLDRLDPGVGLKGLAQAVGEVEATLLPLQELAKSLTIHLVGHGHIDMNWMWSWPETVAATHDTFASVLSLMEQYPELTYSQSQISVYELIERYHPDMFEQIRQRVAEGRWEVAAVQWVEGDKNIVNGESLARHLLYARRYLSEKFGIGPEDMQLDWEPDTFGHANTIPTVLAHGGVKYYYACRTGGGHGHPRVGEERPPLFWWQGPDGSRLLVNRETTWYNSTVNIGDNFALPAVRFCRETGLRDWLNVYGIGNHGGGPTRDELDYFLETREWPIWPTLVFGRAQDWFGKAEADVHAQGIDLPVVDHELNYEFTGCYTSQSAIKRANRFGENYCLEAEALQVLSGIDADLSQAWKNVLFNQFHDILPGSGVAATREHAMGLFQETGAATGAVKRNALKSLCRQIDTGSMLPDTFDGREERALMDQGRANTPFVAGAGQGAGLSGLSRSSGGGVRFRPFVVFNPCAWTRTELVEAHLYDFEVPPESIVATDPEGRSLPTTVLYSGPGLGTDWGHSLTTVLFPAIDVPALGYKTYLLCEGVADPHLPGVSALSETSFRTPHLEIELDRTRAGLADVTLSNGLSPTAGMEPFGLWELTHEIPRGMTSWVLGAEEADAEAVVGSAYRLRGLARNEGTSAILGGASILRAEHAMKVLGTESTVKVTTTLSGLEPRVDFEAEVDWREIGTNERGIPGLRVDFESALFDGESRFETPFGSVVRPDEPREVPTLRYAHRFGDAGEGKVGFTILQDSKPGHASDGSAVAMRVVRSSYDPDHAPEVGKQKVRYSVVFHSEEPTAADLARLGAAWNHPLIAVPATLQEGPLPVAQGYVECLSPNVLVTSLKRADDGNGAVLRLVEYDGIGGEARVRIDPRLGFTRAALCDLAEASIDGKALFAGEALRVPIRPHGIASVRLS